MSAGKVDVLAVMAQASERTRTQSYLVEEAVARLAAHEITQASALVAELIEAAQAVVGEGAQAKREPRRTKRARLAAALAKVLP